MPVIHLNLITIEIVKKLPAGRQLDSLVAERVMGLERVRWECDRLVFNSRFFTFVVPLVPYYSTDPKAAMAVVKLMDSKGSWERPSEDSPLAICRAALISTLAEFP